MKAPEGMKWIDVTYETLRDNYQIGGALRVRAEACMQLLIDCSIADCLIEYPETENCWGYVSGLEAVLKAREGLCRGVYISGSIKDIRIMEDDDE